MAGSFTYTEIKEALTRAGYSPSSGSQWLATDQALYEQYIKNAAYGYGAPDDYAANYGIAYPVAPTWMTDMISSGTPGYPD